jgi:hypothetical protein
VPERATRALQRFSAEPLALAQPTDASGARPVARQQRQLEQQRTRAQERLADARKRLERLGWRGRRGHRAELESEIALYETALQLADEKRDVRRVDPEPARGPQPGDEAALLYDRVGADRIRAVEEELPPRAGLKYLQSHATTVPRPPDVRRHLPRVRATGRCRRRRG